MLSSSRFSRSALATLLLALTVLLLWFVLPDDDHDAPAASDAQATPAPNATPVVVAPAVAARDDVVLDLVGSALATRSVTLFPAATGEVERVLFHAGDHVKKGQLLVQLVDRKERLAVQLATTERDAADRLLKRYQRTKGSGAVSATVFDEAQIALRRAEIELGQAREQLRDRSVLAPFAGVVGITQIDPGDRVGLDTPLTTLDSRALLMVSFQVPEPFLSRLEIGHAVVLKNVAFPERTFAGKLARIDSRIDPLTRTVNVRAAVPNEENLLRTGMSFSVRLTLPGAPVIQVPELAVQWSRDGSYLWTVRDGKSERVPVRVVRRMEGAVYVDGTLQAGDAIVVEGVQRLRPGRLVRIMQENRTAKASAA